MAGNSHPVVRGQETKGTYSHIAKQQDLALGGTESPAAKSFFLEAIQLDLLIHARRDRGFRTIGSRVRDGAIVWRRGVYEGLARFRAERLPHQ
jgi:hypothetical protein